MILRTISGVMAATSCRIAYFRASKVCPVCLKFDTKGKSFSYQEQPPVDQAQSGCEMHAVLLPATIFYKLLNNKGTMFFQPHHGVH